jgi:hypothetical protein
MVYMKLPIYVVILFIVQDVFNNVFCEDKIRILKSAVPHPYRTTNGSQFPPVITRFYN